jgi:hypothetical protein
MSDMSWPLCKVRETAARPGDALQPRIRRRPALILGIILMLLLSAAVAGLPVQFATAHARDLFTPIRGNQLKAATATQRRLIKQIEGRPTTASFTLIYIDVKSLRRCSTTVFLPTERKLTFRDSRVACGKCEFALGVLGGATGEATLVIHGDNVRGSIRAGTERYRIEPLGHGVHAAIKVDTSRAAPEHEPVLPANEHRSEIKSPWLTYAKPVASPVVIDALVAYTPAAACATHHIVHLICVAAADANRTYRNSGINIRLNVVDTFELPYIEGSKPCTTIVDDFSKDVTVGARRNNSGADVSVLIIDSSENCLAGQALKLMADDAHAFAVVHYDHATAPDYTFAHEIGHLQGATHEVDGPAGHFKPYGHGFQKDVDEPLWRTIMAYDCRPNPCPRVPYWSNPRITAPSPYVGAMGTTATNDNARVLNETATTVASFRPSSRPDLCRNPRPVHPRRCLHQ